MQCREQKRAHGGVECFDGKIRQVLNNLFGNAMTQCTPTTGGFDPQPRSNKLEDSATGDHVDNRRHGYGHSTTGGQKGVRRVLHHQRIGDTGLGLWLGKEIVDRLQGRFPFAARTRKHTVELRLRSSHPSKLPSGEAPLAPYLEDDLRVAERPNGGSGTRAPRSTHARSVSS